MLSILIRTYDSSVIELVYEVDQQCQKLDVDYEILISDDNPNGKAIDEKKLNTFENTTYWKNTSNLGRSNNLNKLISASNFDYVLCLDNDVIPLRKNFVETYLDSVKEGYEVVYGGLAYDDTVPDESKILRWVYGHKKEAKSLQERKNKWKYHILVSNLLIRKSAFTQPIFDTDLSTYGYEDLLFSEELKLRRARVGQIDNPVIHKGLETSRAFLNKTKQALSTLSYLVQNHKVSTQVSPITRVYFKMKANMSLKLFLFCIGPNIQRIENQLLSKHPRMSFFNIYKLYHFAKCAQEK